MSGDQGNVLLFKARGGGGWQTRVCCIIYFPAAPCLPSSPPSGCWDPTVTAGTPILTAGTPPAAQHPAACSGMVGGTPAQQWPGGMGCWGPGEARVKKPPGWDLEQLHPPSFGVVVSHGVCGTGVRCHQCPDLHPALPHALPTSRLGWGGRVPMATWAGGHNPASCQHPWSPWLVACPLRWGHRAHPGVDTARPHSGTGSARCAGTAPPPPCVWCHEHRQFSI